MSALTYPSSRVDRQDANAATQYSSAASTARPAKTNDENSPTSIVAPAESTSSALGHQKPAELPVVPVVSSAAGTLTAFLSTAVSKSSAQGLQKPAELVVVPDQSSAAETPRLRPESSSKAVVIASPEIVGSAVSRSQSAELLGKSTWIQTVAVVAKELPGESAWVYTGLPACAEADESHEALSDELYDSDSWSECEAIEDSSPTASRQTASEPINMVQARKPQPTPSRWAEPVAEGPGCRAAEAQSEQLLARRAWEVTGLLRPSLSGAEELSSVQEQLDQANHFLVESLPHAAETVGLTQVSGLVFQALLVRAGLGRGSGPERPSADELDAKLGKAKAMKLADRARELRGLLRVKVEDDGDLALARRVVHDCRRFIQGLAICSERRGMKNWELLQELLHGNQSREGKGCKDVPGKKPALALGGA